MKKQILSSLFWGVILFVVQIIVDVAKGQPIDWNTAIMASVFVVILHFLVSRGRGVVENGGKPNNAADNSTPTKSGNGAKMEAAQNVQKKSISDKAKGNINNKNAKQNSTSEPSSMEKRGYSADDLKFYIFNRNAKLCLIAAVICIIIWYLKSSAWFLYVSIAFVMLAGVYYVLYLRKRDMFIEKQRKEKEKK